VVKVLHDAFKKGMEEQSYKDAMLKLDMEPYYMNTADYQGYAMQQIGEPVDDAQQRVVEAFAQEGKNLQTRPHPESL
jgi:hypothetical protein